MKIYKIGILFVTLSFVLFTPIHAAIFYFRYIVMDDEYGGHLYTNYKCICYRRLTWFVL